MGQLASPGKLPSTVLRNKVHPKCKSREGKEGNQYTVKAGLLGRAPRAVRRLPVRPGDTRSQPHGSGSDMFSARAICSGEDLQTTPPSSGQRAEPEMPASPWTLGLGAGRGTPGGRAPRGVLLDWLFKGTLCAASVRKARSDGGHLLSGCNLGSVLGQPAVGPRPRWVTCPSPIFFFFKEPGGSWLQA